MFKKSIVLPAFFPSSMDNTQHFLNTIRTLKNYDICSIDFYYKGNDRKTIKEYLISHDIKSIYLGAMAAKQKNLNLSSPNKELREESVQEMKKCIDDAYSYGSYSILSFGSSEVTLRISIKVKPMTHLTHWGAERELKRRIKNSFDEKGIEIPFPRQVIYLRSEKELG